MSRPGDPPAPTGKLLFEDEPVPGEIPGASGQLVQKSKKRKRGGKLQQETEQPRPSERLRHDDPLPGGDRLSGEATAAPDPGAGERPSADTGGGSAGAAPPTPGAGTSAPDGGATPSSGGAVPKADKKALREGKKLSKSKLRMEQTEAKLGAAYEKRAKQKPPKKPGIVKKVGGVVKAEAWAVVHGKIYQAENENVGVKAAHRVELAGEGVVHSATRFIKRRIRTRPAREVRKWEKKNSNARADYQFRTMAREHPELNKNAVSRYTQKRKLKKQYQKQAKEAARNTGKLARRAGEAAAKTGRVIVTAVARHPVAALILVVAFLLIVTLQSCVGGAMTIGQGILSAIGGSSYLTQDADITNAGLAYTEWETDLMLEAQNAEESHPGYDEYVYNLDPVGHDHIALISFLTARFDDFTYADVEAALREIFDAQYELTFTERVEQRGGEGDEEPYDWYVLEVTLTARPFSEVLAEMLTAGDEQDRYDIYNITKGNRQYVGSPFPGNWLPYVTDTFGWRVHPVTGERDFHRAIDIALPAGTDILAGGDGVVIEATTHELYGQTVRIDYGEGITARYSHCSALLVSAGQTVKAGEVIARVGSTGQVTGAHLDLEVLKEGELLNPLNFVNIPI